MLTEQGLALLPAFFLVASNVVGRVHWKACVLASECIQPLDEWHIMQASIQCIETVEREYLLVFSFLKNCFWKTFLVKETFDLG